jgi:hypothetical protein
MLLVTLRGFMGSRLVESGWHCFTLAGQAGRHVTPEKTGDYVAVRMTKASMFSS